MDSVFLYMIPVVHAAIWLLAGAGRLRTRNCSFKIVLIIDLFEIVVILNLYPHYDEFGLYCTVEEAVQRKSPPQISAFMKLHSCPSALFPLRSAVMNGCRSSFNCLDICSSNNFTWWWIEPQRGRRVFIKVDKRNCLLFGDLNSGITKEETQPKGKKEQRQLLSPK